MKSPECRVQHVAINRCYIPTTQIEQGKSRRSVLLFTLPTIQIVEGTAQELQASIYFGEIE